jgi:microcystin-dependent protein
MTLNEVKTFVVGTIKQAFTNKKTLDKFDDSTGTLKYDGQKINNFPVFVADDAPICNIIAFMGNSAPQDYLICDGTEYNIADYPLLAQHILDEFGSYNYFGGDGTATFAVPDLRGEFLRGTGTATRNTGSGAEVGEHQEPTQHIQLLIDSNNKLYVNGGSKKSINQKNRDNVYYSPTTTGFTQDASSTTWSGNGNTHYSSRPTNTSVLYCIKYQITQNNISKDIVNYSLDEQVVGSWVNGKPLYEKTVTFDKTSTGTITTLTELGIKDWDELWVDDGYCINSAGTVRNFFPHDIDIYIQVHNSTYPNGDIRSGDSAKATFIWVLKYTKTTDAENSFTLDMLSNISTLNTIASDEEVNEVIGGI